MACMMPNEKNRGLSGLKEILDKFERHNKALQEEEHRLQRQLREKKAAVRESAGPGWCSLPPCVPAVVPCPRMSWRMESPCTSSQESVTSRCCHRETTPCSCKFSKDYSDMSFEVTPSASESDQSLASLRSEDLGLLLLMEEKATRELARLRHLRQLKRREREVLHTAMVTRTVIDKLDNIFTGNRQTYTTTLDVETVMVSCPCVRPSSAPSKPSSPMDNGAATAAVETTPQQTRLPSAGQLVHKSSQTADESRQICQPCRRTLPDGTTLVCRASQTIEPAAGVGQFEGEGLTGEEPPVEQTTEGGVESFEEVTHEDTADVFEVAVLTSVQRMFEVAVQDSTLTLEGEGAFRRTTLQNMKVVLEVEEGQASETEDTEPGAKTEIEGGPPVSREEVPLIVVEPPPTPPAKSPLASAEKVPSVVVEPAPTPSAKSPIGSAEKVPSVVVEPTPTPSAKSPLASAQKIPTIVEEDTPTEPTTDELSAVDEGAPVEGVATAEPPAEGGESKTETVGEAPCDKAPEKEAPCQSVDRAEMDEGMRALHEVLLQHNQQIRKLAEIIGQFPFVTRGSLCSCGPCKRLVPPQQSSGPSPACAGDKMAGEVSTAASETNATS